MPNSNRTPPSTDMFHLSLLFSLSAVAWLLNMAFGFTVGTIPYGSLFTIAVVVWATVAIADYFKS